MSITYRPVPTILGASPHGILAAVGIPIGAWLLLRLLRNRGMPTVAVEAAFEEGCRIGPPGSICWSPAGGGRPGRSGRWHRPAVAARSSTSGAVAVGAAAGGGDRQRRRGREALSAEVVPPGADGGDGDGGGSPTPRSVTGAPVASSATPAVTVSGSSPLVRAIWAMPLRPNVRASAPAISGRWRSLRCGSTLANYSINTSAATPVLVTGQA